MLACKIWLKQQVQKNSTISCCGFTQYTYTTLHGIHSIRWAAERSFSQRCTSNRIIKMSNSWIYKRFPFHQKAIKLSISNSINDSVFSMAIIKYKTKDILNRNTGTLIQKKNPIVLNDCWMAINSCFYDPFWKAAIRTLQNGENQNKSRNELLCLRSYKSSGFQIFSRGVLKGHVRLLEWLW